MARCSNWSARATLGSILAWVAAAKIYQRLTRRPSAYLTLARLSAVWSWGPDVPFLAPLTTGGTALNHQGDAAICDDIFKQKVKMLIINALLIAACAHAAGDATTFRPWALNDSKAFVFPRIAEKRNRGRRERLAAALSNGAGRDSESERDSLGRRSPAALRKSARYPTKQTPLKCP